MPSFVSVRSLNTVPALFTRTSRRSKRRRNSSARRLTSACWEKSQRSDDTSAPGAPPRTSSRQRAVLAASRPTITTLAPCLARLRAASKPIPLVAPVTQTLLPRMSQIMVRGPIAQGGIAPAASLQREARHCLLVPVEPDAGSIRRPRVPVGDLQGPREDRDGPVDVFQEVGRRRHREQLRAHLGIEVRG